MKARAIGRLKKEAEDLKKNFGDIFEADIKGEDMMLWHVKFQGAEGSVYKGEEFTL